MNRKSLTNRTKQVLSMAMLFVSAISFLVGCDDDISPIMYEMRRNDTTLLLFGTMHALPPGVSLDSMPKYVTSALDEADMLIVESLPDQIPAEEARSIQFGTDERPSVRQMINDWDSARRENFLEALVEFPAYSSVEQTEVVLELRPWVAQSYTAALMNNLGETPSSGPTSVEAWLFEYAEDHGLPIQPLENPLRTWKAQDAMSQERSLLELEELILIRPDAEVVARASRMLLESGYEDWAEGRAVTDPFLFAREIGAPADGWGYQLNEDLGTLMYEWREDIWIETLDEILQQRTDVDTLFVSVGFAHLHTEEKPFSQDLQDERWELIRQWP